MVTFLDVAHMVDATLTLTLHAWTVLNATWTYHLFRELETTTLLVSQFQWRRSIGVVSGATFLHELSRVFAERGRNSR